MVAHADVVIAVLGVSAGLSGFVLVFLGFIVSTYQSFSGSTPAGVLSKYRTIGVLLLVAFGIGMICLTLAVAWLVERNDSPGLYVATLVVFAVQLVALVTATVVTARRVLWGA